MSLAVADSVRTADAPFQFHDAVEANPDSIAEISWCGSGLSFSCGGEETIAQPWRPVRLHLDSAKPVIVGRQEGGFIEYLDPKYRPTQIGPSGQTVLMSCGHGSDNYVSRGHFTIRCSSGGVLFINGVPRPDRTIRPPLNGTYLLEPEARCLGPGEAYHVLRGQQIKIRLPNGTEVTIAAA